MQRKTVATSMRIAMIAAALAFSLGSAANRRPNSNVGNYAETAPTPQSMDSTDALGLWRSSFGAVKIERDASRGGEALMGVWVYDRQGQEVIGFFSGSLRGNVFEFSWQEPNSPQDLLGAGYLVFTPGGQNFSGRWWTNARDRTGDWSGWRDSALIDATRGGDSGGVSSEPLQGGAYGGQSYGGQPYGDPY